MSWSELRAEVARAAQALREAGVERRRPGGRHPAQHAREHRRRAGRRVDRRGVVVLLARLRRAGRARPLRPDRAQGADRLRRLLLRRQDHRHRRQARRRSSPSCRRCARSSSCPISAATTAVVQGLNTSLIHKGARAQTWGDAVHRAARRAAHFERLPFAHPLYVLFSSGTTGMPKCIVHSAGGTLLKHLCEQRLHADVRAGDRLFYFTTLGWMMWNWLVSGLAAGRHAAALRRLAVPSRRQHPVGLCAGREVHAVRHVGQIHRRHQEGRAAPGKTHDLSSIRTVLSTGSPLAPDSFEYIYAGRSSPTCTSPPCRAAPTSVGCFVLGVPTKPV